MPHKRRKTLKRPSLAQQKKIVRDYFDFKASARGQSGPVSISDAQLKDVKEQLRKGDRGGYLTMFERYLGQNLGMWEVKPYS